MCSANLYQAAVRCARRAFHSSRKDAAGAESLASTFPTENNLTVASSIEYREAHRGFVIRVLSIKPGELSLVVEDSGVGAHSGLDERLREAGCSKAQIFPNFDSAIAAVVDAKRAIETHLHDRRS